MSVVLPGYKKIYRKMVTHLKKHKITSSPVLHSQIKWVGTVVLLIHNRECPQFIYICNAMKVDMAEYINIRNQTNNTGVWVKNLGEGSRHFPKNVFSSNSRSHHFDLHLACMKPIHFNVFKSQRA